MSVDQGVEQADDLAWEFHFEQCPCQFDDLFERMTFTIEFAEQIFFGLIAIILLHGDLSQSEIDAGHTGIESPGLSQFSCGGIVVSAGECELPEFAVSIGVIRLKLDDASEFFCGFAELPAIDEHGTEIE